ncbi:sugar ABC transporter permease [Spirochaetia bacterium]|nr:sugar ABC transporter permease [Spirochaetia bacterium]
MKGSAKRKRIFRREDAALYIMALPGIAFLLIFCYLPMGGLVMAFQNYNNGRGVFGSSFAGLKNFEFLFSTTDAFIITRNTVLYNLAFIIINMVLAVIMALILSLLRSRRTAKVLQTIYMMPYFLSYAVISIIVYAFLYRDHGLVNMLFRAFGMPDKTNWYQQIALWPPLLIGINAWKGVGYQTVLYLAVISGISQDYYEAAMLDGASKLQQAFHITIPHLRFMAGISLIMSMGSLFRGDFGLFYTVPRNSGMIYRVTDVIDTYIYRGLTTMNNVSMSTAAGLYQSVVGLILVLAVNAIVKKIDPENGMF